MKNFLSAGQIKTLKEKHRYCKDKRQADRIKTILCLNMGYEYKDIAELLLLDDSTLRNYHAEYLEGGIEKLLGDDYKGRFCYLNEEQLQELDLHIQDTIYIDSKELAAYIEKAYGICYTHSAVKKLLHRLGFVYKKPKHIPGKADAVKQQEFIEKYELLKKNKRKEDKVFFVDGVHPLHNSQPAYGWIKKGKEKAIKANTGRQRLNINGAYDIESHKVIIREDESINAQSTIALFEQMLKEYPFGMLYIILDNARYYRSKVVREFLNNHSRIELVFLPPYSPNLNIIERLWRFFKKKTTYNEYYEKFSVFKEACLNFFANIKDYHDELETLMTEKFHIIQNEELFPCVRSERPRCREAVLPLSAGMVAGRQAWGAFGRS